MPSDPQILTRVWASQFFLLPNRTPERPQLKLDKYHISDDGTLDVLAYPPRFTTKFSDARLLRKLEWWTAALYWAANGWRTILVTSDDKQMIECNLQWLLSRRIERSPRVRGEGR